MHRYAGAIGRNDYAVIWSRGQRSFVRVYIAPDGERRGGLLWGTQPLSEKPLAS